MAAAITASAINPPTITQPPIYSETMREREMCSRCREREIDKNAGEENHQEEGIDVEVVTFHTQTTRFISDRTSIQGESGTRPELRHGIQLVDLTTTCETEAHVEDKDVACNERHSFLAGSPLAVPPEPPRTHLMRVASLLN